MKRKNDGLAKKILFCWIGSGPIGPWSGSEKKEAGDLNSFFYSEL